MSLQCYLRLALVGLTLSVVGCLPDVPLGDVMDDAQVKIQALESFKSVNSPIQNPTRDNKSFPKNIGQFNSKPQLAWIRPASDNQRHEVNAKNPIISPTDSRASADVISSVPNKVQSNLISRNVPVEFSSSETDAKRSYAFPTVQWEKNPLDFKERQMSSSDINLAPKLVRKKDGSNVHRSGSFGYQPKSEMHSDSSPSLGLNEPHLRESIAANYMSRSSAVNYNIRHESDGNKQLDKLLQNNGQDQNVLRRVLPANKSPSVLTTVHERETLPQAPSAGTGIVSYENMKGIALSKVLKPPTILAPVSPAFIRSDSNAGSILPIVKSKMFSSQRDNIKLSNSAERLANPNTNLQSVFEHGNTKSATSSHALKNIQLTQNGYQNRGEGSQSGVSIKTFHDQKKYDRLATGISAIRPPVTNNARFYFQSDENRGIRTSKQNTDLQFTKNKMLFSERDKNINLPDTANHSLMKQSQHNTKNRTPLNSFGQSTVQSLSVKQDLAPSLVPGNTMKNRIHSISPTVSSTQSIYKNLDTSSSRNRPYYLTSKKPYAFFDSALETPQKSDQKPLLEYLSHPHTAQSALSQKPLTRESNKKTLFQEKPPHWDQTDSFLKNGPQRQTISSTEGVSNPMSDVLKHHPVRGQAVTMKASLFGTSATNKGAVDEIQSKTSQRWTSSGLVSAQPTESNPDELPKARFSNGSFLGSNLNKASIKSSSSHNSPTSELVLPIYKSSLMNKGTKVTGYAKIHKAVIQPLHGYSLKGHENSAGTPQSNTGQKYSPESLRPTSSVVIGRQVEDTSERQNVYAISTSQSPIYRSSDVNRYKTNKSAKPTFQSPIYRAPKKPSGKANILQANAGSDWRKETSQISEADIDLSAVGVSQALRPTSSLAVRKYIDKFDKTSTKANHDTYSAKPGLNHYKPLRFLDIAGSASFTDLKLNSAGTTAKEKVELKSVQNATSSTSVKEESLKKRVFVSSSALLNERNESTVEFRVSELMPRAAIDFTTQSQPSSLLTEEHAPPQPTVYSFESQQDPGNNTSPTAEDTDPFYEGTLMPNTTLQDKMTSS